MHDPDYRVSLKDWNSYVECLTQKIIEVDETVPELPVKDVVSHAIHLGIRGGMPISILQVFRIYRDVRFSKDPTPYKVQQPIISARNGLTLLLDCIFSGMVRRDLSPQWNFYV